MRSPIRTTADHVRRGWRELGNRRHPRAPAAAGAHVLVTAIGLGFAMVGDVPVLAGAAIVVVTFLLAYAVSALILGWR